MPILEKFLKRSKISNQSFHLRTLEEEEQIKFKTSRIKEVIRIREEINEMENRKLIKKVSTNISWFFGKITKIKNS